VLLGVGVGGDRHEQSWLAAGVSRRDRGRLTDEGLRVLPGLIAGKPTVLPSGAQVRFEPAATVPPIIVGGMSDAAVRRIDEHGAGWFLIASPDDIPAQLARVRGSVPEVTASAMVAIDGDPTLPDHASVVRSITDPDGLYAFPPEAAESALISGDPAAVAARLASFVDAEVHRIVVTSVAGDWFRQAELLAEALRLL
jgi:alkanesulfonate monooxygenase SsuD/methylene tetrahydromethanopterin reductase-like flavin-dependent oxidoreductase (luciferase family)